MPPVRPTRKRNPDRWGLTPWLSGSGQWRTPKGESVSDPLYAYISTGIIPDPTKSLLFEEREYAKAVVQRLRKAALEAKFSPDPESREAAAELLAKLPKSNPHKNPRGATHTIVVAWVQMSGLDVDHNTPNYFYGTSYTATAAADPKATMWANAGTAADVKKAKAFIASDRLSSYPVEWKGVFVYPVTEKDPLNRARREALAAFSKKRKKNPSWWPFGKKAEAPAAAPAPAKEYASTSIGGRVAYNGKPGTIESKSTKLVKSRRGGRSKSQSTYTIKFDDGSKAHLHYESLSPAPMSNPSKRPLKRNPIDDYARRTAKRWIVVGVGSKDQTVTYGATAFDHTNKAAAYAYADATRVRLRKAGKPSQAATVHVEPR